MKTISIIIPVYGVEKYIEKCVRSLFEQTYENLEYIFVNDCTKDSSMEILKTVLSEYPDRISNVTIINNEKNIGQSGSRKKGILAANGHYMIHCDSDDWVDLDYYEKIAKKAEETDADIICCDYRAEFQDGRFKDFVFTDYDCPHDRILARKQYIWSLWGNCLKSSFVREYNILPPENINMTEDMNMLMRAYYFASSIANVHGPKYHYLCQRTDSITSDAIKNKNHYKVQVMSLQQIDSFYKEHNFDPGEGFLVLKQSARDCFMRIGDYQSWKSTFPETVRYTFANRSLPFLYRFVYVIGAKGFLFPLRFYRWLSSIK